MRGLAVFKMVIWGIVAVFFIGVLISSVLHRGFFGEDFLAGFGLRDDDRSYEVVGNYTISGDIHEISVLWKTGKVRLLPSTENDIRITESAPSDSEKDDLLQYEVKDGALTVRQGNTLHSILLFGLNRSTHVDVYLPDKLYGTISAECTSGQIEATGMNCISLALKTASGEITLLDVKTDKTTIHVTSGAIAGDGVCIKSVDCDTKSGRIDLKGSMEDISVNCTSGEVSVDTDVQPGSLSADVTSGTLAVSLPENDGFNVRYNATSGSIQSDFALMYMSMNSKNGSATYKDGGPEYQLNVVSGKIQLIRRS